MEVGAGKSPDSARLALHMRSLFWFLLVLSLGLLVSRVMVLSGDTRAEEHEAVGTLGSGAAPESHRRAAGVVQAAEFAPDGSAAPTYADRTVGAGIYRRELAGSELNPGAGTDTKVLAAGPASRDLLFELEMRLLDTRGTREELEVARTLVELGTREGSESALRLFADAFFQPDSYFVAMGEPRRSNQAFNLLRDVRGSLAVLQLARASIEDLEYRQTHVTYPRGMVQGYYRLLVTNGEPSGVALVVEQLYSEDSGRLLVALEALQLANTLDEASVEQLFELLLDPEWPGSRELLTRILVRLNNGEKVGRLSRIAFDGLEAGGLEGDTTGTLDEVRGQLILGLAVGFNLDVFNRSVDFYERASLDGSKVARFVPEMWSRLDADVDRGLSAALVQELVEWLETGEIDRQLDAMRALDGDFFEVDRTGSPKLDEELLAALDACAAGTGPLAARAQAFLERRKDRDR